MIFREAVIDDICQIQKVRHSVKENVLSNPGLVTDADCADYISNRGRGWVCESQNKIVGFAIVDLTGNRIWALFVLPDFEKQGIGKKLHNIMMNWYFSRTFLTVWLGTAPDTRAASFYRKAGWKETGLYGKTEIRFEMHYIDWMKRCTLQ